MKRRVSRAVTGGMDWLVFDAYFSALRDGMVPPIDTYDTAAWMAITPLSEISIANGQYARGYPGLHPRYVDAQNG